MKLQEALQNSDLDKVLDGFPGDYEKIREFRKKLDEPSRSLFDSIFLIGFREGILLNLYRETHSNGCNGCRFEMCRLGYELGSQECKMVRNEDK